MPVDPKSENIDGLAERNRQTRDAWNQYAPHRARVTELLVRAADAVNIDAGLSAATPQAPRLCILGAGNANDVDLVALAAKYGEIHLVDLDQDALRAAITRQPIDIQAKLIAHGGFDLSVDLSDFDHVAPWPNTFDVVCSAGLMSQLIDGFVARTKFDAATRDALILELRARHLQWAIEQLSPGGYLVAIVDFASSVAAPQLATVSDEQVPQLAAELIRSGNFFTGLNPLALKAMLSTEPWFAEQVEGVYLHTPWRWWVTDRAFAVAAITARRRRPS